MNRSYDPQIGRFLQIDEFGEIAEEWSTYVFGYNNPVLYNDPLGLFSEDREDPVTPKETSTAEKPTELSNVTVVGAKGLWGKTRLYYQMMDYTGGDLGRIVNDRLRADMVTIDGIVKHRERVAEMTREQDKVTLEAASWFIPTGAILKVFKFKKVLSLFKIKRGKSVVKATEELSEEVLKHGDDVANSGDVVRKSVGAATANFDKVLQTGGNKIKKATLKALGLTKEEGKIAIEALKKDLGLPADYHGKIMGNGDLRNSVGEVLGNLFDYLP